MIMILHLPLFLVWTFPYHDTHQRLFPEIQKTASTGQSDWWLWNSPNSKMVHLSQANQKELLLLPSSQPQICELKGIKMIQTQMSWQWLPPPDVRLFTAIGSILINQALNFAKCMEAKMATLPQGWDFHVRYFSYISLFIILIAHFI